MINLSEIQILAVRNLQREGFNSRQISVLLGISVCEVIKLEQ